MAQVISQMLLAWKLIPDTDLMNSGQHLVPCYL